MKCFFLRYLISISSSGMFRALGQACSANKLFFSRFVASKGGIKIIQDTLYPLSYMLLSKAQYSISLAATRVKPELSHISNYIISRGMKVKKISKRVSL